MLTDFQTRIPTPTVPTCQRAAPHSLQRTIVKSSAHTRGMPNKPTRFGKPSPWNGYWNAMAVANYDMVWTTGLGNNNGFIPSNTSASSYNGKTATYAYLHTLTGRTILVDTSAGASAAGDSWSSATAAQLNSRISEGVIAANITGTPPNGLQSNIAGLSLNALPSCP